MTKPMSLPEREKIPCPVCEGEGEEVMEMQGHEVVMGCEACRGTGEKVALVRDDLPKINA